jgi:hypothetical protein
MKEHYYGKMDNITGTTEGVTGTDDFVAWEWAWEFVSKENNTTFSVKMGEKGVRKGVSLIWWKNEGGGGGYNGWKVVKMRDYSESVVGH